MKDWLIGSAIVISAALVTALLLFVFGSLMWAMGLPPNRYPTTTLTGGIASLAGGYWYFGWLLERLNKREWDKALGRK